MRQSLPGNTPCVLSKYRSDWNFKCNVRKRESRHFFFCGGDFCDGQQVQRGERVGWLRVAEEGTHHCIAWVTSANNDQQSSRRWLAPSCGQSRECPREREGDKRGQRRARSLVRPGEIAKMLVRMIWRQPGGLRLAPAFPPTACRLPDRHLAAQEMVDTKQEEEICL